MSNRVEYENELGSTARAKHRGPWNDEPDKVYWVDDATGLDCLIVRNRSGALCGYVGLPPGHPMYGADYDSVRTEDGQYPDCNGGLTFAGKCHPGPTEAEGICHVPLPGRPDDVWWLGFDCAHLLYDVCPTYDDDLVNPGATYKTVPWVERQVSSLAVQLAA